MTNVIRTPEDFQSKRAQELITEYHFSLLQICEETIEFQRKHKAQVYSGKIEPQDSSEAYDIMRGLIANAIMFLEFLESGDFSIQAMTHSISIDFFSDKMEAKKGTQEHRFKMHYDREFYNKMAESFIKTAGQIKEAYGFRLSKDGKMRAEKIRVIRKPEDFLSEESRRLIQANQFTLYDIIIGTKKVAELANKGGVANFSTSNAKEAIEYAKNFACSVIIFYEILKYKKIKLVLDRDFVGEIQKGGKASNLEVSGEAVYAREESLDYYRMLIGQYLDIIRGMKKAYDLREPII